MISVLKVNRAQWGGPILIEYFTANKSYNLYGKSLR